VDAYDGDDMLGKHLKSGRKMDEHTKLCKLKVYKAWVGKDYDNVAKQVQLRIAMVSAIRPRVDDDHLAYLFVEAFKVSAPTVTNLRWSHICNVLMRPCLKFDKKELVATIREGWVDFMIETISLQTGDAKALPVDELKDRIAKHEAKLALDRNASLTEEQKEAKKLEAARIEMNAAKTGARTKLVKGLAAACVNHKPEEIGRILGEQGVILPQIGPDPVTMTPLAAAQFAKLLYDNRNWAAIMTLHSELGKYIAETANAAKAAKAAAAAALAEQATTAPAAAAPLAAVA
jgi:hypothetical protein